MPAGNRIALRGANSDSFGAPCAFPKRMRRVLALLVFAALTWWLWPDRGLRHPAGVTAPTTPAQEGIPPRALGEFNGYRLEAQASYAIHARVLRTKRYRSRGDDLVPYDVALGWGPMSDQAVLDRLRISQSNRFFFYRWWDQAPLSPGEMVRHAANVHVIAANKTVAKAVAKLRSGQLVAMRGYLVNVSKPGGFSWNTSLRRDDEGNGACEVFYVEELLVSDKPLPVNYATLTASGAPQ
jgi:hypothetical protein